MKRLAQWYAGILIVIMALIVVHAPLSVGLGTLFPDGALLIKAWKEILMAVAAVLMIVLVIRSGRTSEFLHDRLIIVVLGYIGLHLVSLINWPGLARAAAGLAIDLRYVVYFVLAYILVRLYPEYRRLLIRTAAIGAGVVVALACVQMVLPRDILTHIGYGPETIQPYQMVDQNPDFIRSQSSLRGPNPFSAYMIIVVSCIAAYLLAGGLYRNAALVGLGVSTLLLYLGYSRSALIGGVAALALLVVMKYRARLTGKRVAMVMAGIVIIGAAMMIAVRSDFGATVLLHTDPNEASQVNSDDKRLDSLMTGLSNVATQPFGVGVGSTGSASLLGTDGLIIENQYLFVAHEVGWLGLVLFMILFVMVMSRLWRDRRRLWSGAIFASGVGLALVGLFLPVWTDDTVSIVWWGLAGILIAGGVQAHDGQSTEQKAARTT